MSDPTPAEIDRISRALGWRPARWHDVTDRGPHANTAHWLVKNGDRQAFVKVPRADLPGEWLRREHQTLVALNASGADFAPEVVGWSDDGAWPLLALEDLSAATWPPPWAAASVGVVLETLRQVESTPPPSHLQPIEIDPSVGWASVESDSEPFLRLGLCSAGWLETSLPVLTAAGARAPLAGDSLIHLDVRSDNLCFPSPRRAILVDWNHATIANPALDVAFWLPSLESEGGPSPDQILPEAPELAAWVAGFFCSRAGLPPIPDAPHVRPLQVAQAGPALAWAARALDLPPPS
jgi:hypothetical protein